MSRPPAWDGPDGGGGPHVFVDNLDAPQLDPRDYHHLQSSLRLRDDDPLTVSDGTGFWRPCRFGPTLIPDGEIIFVTQPAASLTIGFALTKGSKPELVVQKLTELGIDRLIPFVAERSIATWDPAKAEKQQSRFSRIARQAAMQSRQVRVPAVEPLTNFSAIAHPAALRADRSGVELDPSHTTVLIGPEGGWSPAERRSLAEVCLGPHVLRAETAAIAAATLMTRLRYRPLS